MYNNMQIIFRLKIKFKFNEVIYRIL